MNYTLPLAVMLALSLPTCGSDSEESKSDESIISKETFDHLKKVKETLEQQLNRNDGEREAAFKAFRFQVESFEAERKSFYEDQKESVIALNRYREIRAREAALEVQAREMRNINIAVVAGSGIFIVLSWIAFYFLLAGPLGRKIAATIIARKAELKD